MLGDMGVIAKKKKKKTCGLCPSLPGKVVGKRYRARVIKQDSVEWCVCWFLEVLRWGREKWKKKVNKEAKNRGYRERVYLAFMTTFLSFPSWGSTEMNWSWNGQRELPRELIWFGTWRKTQDLKG